MFNILYNIKFIYVIKKIPLNVDKVIAFVLMDPYKRCKIFSIKGKRIYL